MALEPVHVDINVLVGYSTLSGRVKAIITNMLILAVLIHVKAEFIDGRFRIRFLKDFALEGRLICRDDIL